MVEDQGKEKKIRFGMRIIICLVSASGQQLSVGKFSSEDSYPSNACSPALSLILSILYFPPPPPSTTAHVTLTNVCLLHPLSPLKDWTLTAIDIPSSNSNASLPGGRSFWGKWGGGGHTPKSPKDAVIGHEPQMTIARTRLLTLCYGDMETIRMVCNLRHKFYLTSQVTDH